MRRFGTFFVLLLTLLLETAFAQQTQPSSPPTSSSAVESKTGGSQESSETQGNPDIRVWVNTKSGVYHCPATHWYGATKTGSYMKQSEARQKGFRPAYHRPCH
jgi:hypothetical protein